MIVIKAAILSLSGIVIANYFKNNKSEYGLITGLSVSIIIFYFIVLKLQDFLCEFKEITYVFNDKYGFITILLKMLGLSYVSELSAGICKDAGYQSVASQIIILGKITIMVMGTSIIVSFIQLINMYLR